MKFKIPQPLKAEHEELHVMLKQATLLSGKTGEAAKAVAGLMHPHFVKEEEYALPPLGMTYPSGFKIRKASIIAFSGSSTKQIEVIKTAKPY